MHRIYTLYAMFEARCSIYNAWCTLLDDRCQLRISYFTPQASSLVL